MTDDDEAKYAQAVRFLTSLRSQKSQDLDSQRQFLQSKGLSEELIAHAFQDVKRPEGVDNEDVSSTGAATMTASSEDDKEAFEKAAKMFDEPIATDATSKIDRPPPEAPPKTYPRSPLALYYQPQPGQYGPTASQMNVPQTRYQVLLSFFRSLCYFLVLGGGVTGAAVALYRTYLLPRMISTLDSRSSLLKHHLDQFGIITNKIKSLRSNSLAPNSQAGPSVPLKGVLKKVQFADEISAEKRTHGEQDKKEAGEKIEADVEEKSALLEGQETSRETSDEINTNEKAAFVKPIDVLEPVRSSMNKLGQALRGEATAGPSTSEMVDATNLPSSKPPAVRVEDESDADSWVSEDDSDELEFDPYSQSTRSSSKRKHDPASAKSRPVTKSTSNLSSSSSSAAAASLQSSLSTLNAYINSQTYMASAHVYGGGRSFGMSGFGSTANNTDKENGSKVGDVAQIRADIRNLKGLLLSRRNFPTYRTPATSTTAVGNTA